MKAPAVKYEKGLIGPLSFTKWETPELYGKALKKAKEAEKLKAAEKTVTMNEVKNTDDSEFEIKHLDAEGNSLFDLEATMIDGETKVKIGDLFKDKKAVLFVNVASK